MTKAKPREYTLQFDDSIQEIQFPQAAGKEILLDTRAQFQEMRLRLPLDLYHQIAVIATQNNRSLNSEIIRCLRMSYAETLPCRK